MLSWFNELKLLDFEHLIQYEPIYVWDQISIGFMMSRNTYGHYIGSIHIWYSHSMYISLTQEYKRMRIEEDFIPESRTCNQDQQVTIKNQSSFFIHNGSMYVPHF